MTVSESIVETAALELFADLGYIIGHSSVSCPHQWAVRL